MQLTQRLKQLIGHEVFPTMQTERDGQGIPGGILVEVGLDYVVIRTRGNDEGGHVKVGADWLVRLNVVSALIHPSDCTTCAIELWERL
jgi:hypothetical protein